MCLECRWPLRGPFQPYNNAVTTLHNSVIVRVFLLLLMDAGSLCGRIRMEAILRVLINPPPLRPSHICNGTQHGGVRRFSHC
jgi:hypothetical protein